MKSLQELLANVAVVDADKKSRGYFQPSSGRACYILDPINSFISFNDIALALSRLPRFGCMYSHRVKVPYTVAQHSVLVSEVVSPENQLEALLHDATEAYLGDVISPLKRLLPDYKNIEKLWAMEIGRRAGLGDRLASLSEETTRADLTMLLSEKAMIKLDDPDGDIWGLGFTADDCVPIGKVWGEQEAYDRFVNRFVQLSSQWSPYRGKQ